MHSSVYNIVFFSYTEQNAELQQHVSELEGKFFKISITSNIG